MMVGIDQKLEKYPVYPLINFICPIFTGITV